MRLLLLGKGAVWAHGFDRPLAVELDDEESLAGWLAGGCGAYQWQ